MATAETRALIRRAADLADEVEESSRRLERAVGQLGAAELERDRAAGDAPPSRRISFVPLWLGLTLIAFATLLAASPLAFAVAGLALLLAAVLVAAARRSDGLARAIALDHLLRPSLHRGLGAASTEAGVISCVLIADADADATIAYELSKHLVDVVARSRHGEDALETIEAVGPDLVVVGGSSLRRGTRPLVRALASRIPGIPIVVFGRYEDADVLRDALGAGARGAVLQEAPSSELARAAVAVALGGVYVDPALRVAATDADAPARLALTPSEREVLALLADGLSAEEIGSRARLTSEAVTAFARAAVRKLSSGANERARRRRPVLAPLALGAGVSALISTVLERLSHGRAPR